jgi:hypothetical protein
MTNHITYLFLETHDWGAAVKYWQQIGYEVDLDLGQSGRLVNAAGGPALFITEMPKDHPLSTQIAIRTDQEGWHPEAPAKVTKDWHDSHWGTRIMTIQDPDGREMLVQLNGD